MTAGLDPTGIVSHPDEFHRGQAWKRPVRVATTGNVTIATGLNAGDVVDGVTLAAGDRVLAKSQTAGSQNGIYLAGATPIRDFDMDQDLTSDTPQDEVLGAFVYVLEGTVNGGKLFHATNTAAPTLGTTALVFAEWAPGGAPSGAAGGDLSGTYPNPSVVDDSHDHGTIVKALTNKSGASVAAGDVVVISAANADAFTTTIVAQATFPVGIALEAIANNATGRVALAGYVATVNTNGSTFSLRTYLETNGSAKQATANATVRQGTFGVVLGTGANPDAILFGSTNPGGGSGLTDPMTTRGDLIVRNSSNVTDRLAVGAANKFLHSNGTDPSWQQVVEADLALTDITTADASTSAHGFLKKLPGGTTTFLRADGSFATPPGTGTSFAMPSVKQAVLAGNAATSLTVAAAAAGHSFILFTNSTTGQVTSPTCTNVTWTQLKIFTSTASSFYALWVGVVAGGASGTTITMTKPGSFNTAVVLEVTDTLTPTLGQSGSGNTSIINLGITNTKSLTGHTAGHLVAIANGQDNTGISGRIWPGLPCAGLFESIGCQLVVGYLLSTDLLVNFVEVNSASAYLIGEIT